MSVQVVEGDLLDQDVDVIVNAWNRNIIPWWLLLPQGVSGAIKRRGGTGPFKELRKHGSIPLGGAVLTSAGRLPFKGIIHVAGINMLWRASEWSICQCVRNAMALAVQSGFHSIALPLIGAGSGGFDQERARAIMEDELAKLEHPLDVRLVVFRKPKKEQRMSPTTTTRQPPNRRRWRHRMLWILCGLLVLVGVVVIGAWWTIIRMPGRSHRGSLPPADGQVRLLAAELRQHIVYLAQEIGERNVLRRPRELARAADYIEAELKKLGYEAKRQEYEVSRVVCCNLEAEIPGTTRHEEIVVVGAHYDSVVGSPGANDNGSGVAALLALARRFSGGKTGRTLRFVAFVNEEPPFFQTDLMGSWVYARRCRQRDEKVTAMLSLETIGYYSDDPGSQKYPQPFGLLYPSTGNFIGFVGNLRSRGLVRQSVGAFRQGEQFPSEGAALPAAIPGVGFSDHWSFWQEGYPAAMVTDTAMFRYPQYHQLGDTVDKIDFERMARVVRGLEKVVGVLVGAE